MQLEQLGVPPPAPDRQALLRTIEALEGQRSTLGDIAVDLALAPLRARLAGTGADLRAVALDRIAERKIVTVVFLDVAGFTEMSERIGSEATRDIVNGLFDRLVPVVERYGGVVDKFIGDEVMAVFGAPRTVERHAEHALRAALAMFAALDEYNRARGLSLALHAGVNTGEVVAGAVGSAERHAYSVTGDAVNVAARLEGTARSGEIVVGPSTYRHTFQLFEFEPLEPLSLKGKARPIAAYRVIGPKIRRTRVRTDGLQLPFSGRAAQLDALLALARTDAARPRGAVFVRAEPGLGKSRLVSELRDRLAGQVRWLEASGEDYRSDLSYGVVSELVDALVGLPEGAQRDDATHAYADFLNGIGSERARQALPYLFRVRGLPLDDNDEAALATLGADALRQRVTQAVADLVAAATSGQPTVVCIEDVHWGDASSMALLRSLAGDAALAHVLFLLTTRPDRSAATPWIDALAAEAHPRVVELAPLPELDSRMLLDQAFATGSTPGLVAEIGAKAQGNPLYLASFLRSLVDSGVATLADGRLAVDAPIATLAIPDTLQAVVGSQIDRLPALGKDVLHWAAILGNTFATRDVARIARAEGAGGIDAMLSLLCERQLLETDADGRLRFVHALVRDVGYDQLLERERRRLHGVAARIIEEDVALVSEPSEADVALLAWHLERASDHARASLRYEQAAALAAASHAHSEEVAYLESAMRLADAADWWRRAQLEERAGDALQMIGRYAEAAARFENVIASTKAPVAIDMARLYRKIGRTWTIRFDAGQVNKALDEARRWLVSTAERDGEAWWREHFAIELFAMWALYMQGRTEEMAELAASLEPDIEARAALSERGVFHRNIALLRLRQQRYRPDTETVDIAARASDELRRAGDPVDYCFTTFGHAFTQLWNGAVEEADRGMQQVLNDTVRLADAERNLLCLVYLAIASRQLGNLDTAEAFAKAAVARAQANRSSHYEAVSHGTLAWVAWRRGDGDAADRAIELAQQSTIPMYPFVWVYAAVAVARAVERRDMETAATMVARMLEPSHQRLDPDVESIFEAARSAPRLEAMQAVVDACRRQRYL